MINTPPPCRTSPSYQQLSPPLHAAANYVLQNASQPYVLCSTESGKSLVSMDQHPSEGEIDGGVDFMQGVTYEEHSIEIMKSNSKDDEMLPRL
jgi:hypothetical protein